MREYLFCTRSGVKCSVGLVLQLWVDETRTFLKIRDPKEEIVNHLEICGQNVFRKRVAGTKAWGRNECRVQNTKKPQMPESWWVKGRKVRQGQMVQYLWFKFYSKCNGIPSEGFKQEGGASFPSLHFILRLLYCWQPPNTAIILNTWKLGNSVLFRYVHMRVCVDGGSRVGEEGPLLSALRIYRLPWANPDGQILFCTNNAMMMVHDEAASDFILTSCQALSTLQISLGLISHRNPRNGHYWHLGFTDEHPEFYEGKRLARINPLGIKPRSLDLLFSVHFKVLLICIFSQEASPDSLDRQGMKLNDQLQDVL